MSCVDLGTRASCTWSYHQATFPVSSASFCKEENGLKVKMLTDPAVSELFLSSVFWLEEGERKALVGTLCTGMMSALPGKKGYP